MFLIIRIYWDDAVVVREGMPLDSEILLSTLQKYFDQYP
jgi:hypothetical protein